MRHSPRNARVVLLLSLTALVAAACGGMKSSSSTPSNTTLSSMSNSLGTILVDNGGNTLYLFLKDKGGTSSCSGACATNWPPYAPTGKLVAGSGVKASLMHRVTRADGKKQLVYNGHPLYTFGGDSKSGDANGQGANAFGALWYVVSPSGAAITKAAPKGGY
jgi:predicted lipoprotein with Yx(FWY)xxD motif